MKVLLKTILPVVATSSLMLASCKDAKPKIEEEQNPIDYSLKQAELDSAAYRQIFNSTMAAKDSGMVARFNELASSMKSTFNELDRMLIDEGISTKEYNMDNFKLGDEDTSRVYQHFVDSWMYKNFFKKNGLLTDSVAKKCDEVAIQTKP